MIVYKKGDLFQAPENILAHGCNCAGGFGSGIAGQIAIKYPMARFEYMKKYENEGWVLGDVQFSPQSDKKIIANCATQQKFFPRNVCHADYDAIRKALTEVKNVAKAAGSSIAMPKIGAGLAGGDWNIIKNILDEVFDDYDVTVYEL